MIVPMNIAITWVHEVETHLLVVKIPISNDGDAITSIQPVKIKDVTDTDQWAEALSTAFASALSEASLTWGKPADLRRKLFMPEATKLAASNL